jgi:NADPH:quinone reductase-like Zn-dependent oxidoreductase
MKAAIIEQYGSADVFLLREIATPAPGDNEVLVRIRATVATPSDVAFRSAEPFIVRFFAGLLKPNLRILGDNIAGEVEAVGRAVTRFRPGDRVYGTVGVGLGAYAQYCCIAEDAAIEVIPDNLSHAEAVSLAEAFLTAQPFIRDEAKLQPGQSILVNGASGSIGSVAVQLARLAGATVTGVCSTRNVALVRSLGADHVIDYTREDFTAAAGAYDVVFDAVGKSSFARARGCLKPGGAYLTTVPSFAIAGHMLVKPRGYRAKLATTGLRPEAEKRRDMQLLSELAAAGKLRAVIDRHYPLEAIAEAHRYVETGRKVGSVVIEVG